MSNSSRSKDKGKDATPTNPRGIPQAPFVDRVEDYVSSRAEVEGTLKSFQEMISCVLSILFFVYVFDFEFFFFKKKKRWG